MGQVSGKKVTQTLAGGPLTDSDFLKTDRPFSESWHKEVLLDPTDIGLFRLAERRMNWIDQRQAVLAQNVANVNTPGYKARDLSPFAASLAAQGVTLTTTEPGHLTGSSPAVKGREQPGNGKAPNGNTVSMEDQLGRVAETSSSQEIVTNLYHKYQDMFRTVLGRSG